MVRFNKGLILSVVVAASLLVPARAPAQDNAVLESVGALSFAFLHQAHTNIGLLANARAEEALEEKATDEMLQITTNLIGVIEKQLEGLAKSKLDDANKKDFAEIQAINQLLAKEAKQLKAFWVSEDEADEKAYEKTRKQAQEKFDALSK